jgi:DNA (cytosine-5)-methyltransferase 1
MNTISLFSGIGGLELGIKDYIKVIAFCEKDIFCQQILKKRFITNDKVKIYDDISKFKKNDIQDVEMIMGGFPCQDISNAGHAVGLDGKRSGLVWNMIDLIEYYLPNYVLFENVSNLRNKGLLELLKKMDSNDYDSRWCIIDATAAGALHKRRRIFILCKNRNKKSEKKILISEKIKYHWKEEPQIPRIYNGLEELNSVKTQIKCLGNAVVPEQCKIAFNLLTGKYFSINSDIYGNPQAGENINLDNEWENSVSNYNKCEITKCFKNSKNIPNYGSFSNGKMYGLSSIPLYPEPIYPNTIQRFKKTHTIPTPTASEYILRKPTNTAFARAFRPGVNKAVSLNRYLHMFPTQQSEIPELNKDGYLVNDNIVGKIPNPRWVEWLMGLPIGWLDFQV